MNVALRFGRPLLLSLALAGAPQPQEAPNEDLARGALGRRAFAALIEQATSALLEPASTALDVHEASFTLPFVGVEVEGLRVLATGGEEEARAVARELGLARALFTRLTGLTVAFPPGMRAFLLSSSEERDLFLSKHPRVTLDERARLMKLEGTGIPGTADWVFWEGDPEKRRDGLVRFAFDWFLQSLGARHEDHPWLHEGLGFYLTHALTGTRLTWFTQPAFQGGAADAENRALFERMKDGEDWLALAADRFAPERRFDLEELLHLLPRELDPSDYLRLHALAAYLIEVAPATLTSVIPRVGADDDPREVLEEALGFPFAELRPRLDGWLRAREAQASRESGKRTPGELLAQWKKASAEQKRATVKLYKARLAALDTAQMRALRSALALADTAGVRRAELGWFDPVTHAPAQPIARKRLGPGDARVKRLMESVRGKEKPAEPVFDYDWGRAVVLRRDDSEDPESVFQALLRGVPPGAELARARLLAFLDPPEDRKLQAAFENAYADRDGNVFPLTLFELWGSGQTMEMPDVDTLGIVHEVLGEWQRWVAPVPPDQHPALYSTVGDLYRRAKRARELRLVLAETLFLPQVSARESAELSATSAHALWSLLEDDPRRLVATLPVADKAEAFLKELGENVRRDPKYSRGRQRAARLRNDAELLRGAFGAALDEALVAPGGEAEKR
ncbi:MAG: hypothetical protein ABL998_05570 [Planctomycetota bacterium]